VSALFAQRLGSAFPWGTIVVNMTGSFIIGAFATLTGPEGRVLAPVSLRQFFMIGVCGGYTTFSSFSLQTLQLADDGKWQWAAANVLVSVVLCLLGVWAGHSLALAINSSKAH
jgi:CrcB protein